MKLSTLRKWKRDALEIAHSSKTLGLDGVAVSSITRLCEQMATVCFLLERRMKDENFAKEIKSRNREGTD